MTTDPTTPQPQTPEQVVRVSLTKHRAAAFGPEEVRCLCGTWMTHAEFAAHQAAQVVAALGLREEWGVRYSAHTDQAWDQRFPDREAAEREVQDSLGPKPEVTHVVLVGRHATDWSTP